VKGTLERVASESITDAADKKYYQKIGVDKIEKCEQGERTSNVTKTFKEKVEGNVTIETNDEFVDNADELQKIVVTKKMSGEAPEVWIEAVKKIRIKCGTSVITLTKTAIKFEGTNLQMSGDAVDSASKEITNN
jgi:type VI secretion system secreted protein VgrG